MASESWIEPKTRIPFVGIVAIVVIVAVVAIFIKTQLGPLFPPSDVQVQSADSAPALTGRATTSSFIGLREIELHKQERLQGVRNTGLGATTFIADITARMLTISDGTTTEEVVLQPSANDPTVYTAQFDYKNVLTRVDIDVAETMLRYSEPGKSVTPTLITLGTLTTYEGTFRFRNEQYLFQFYPAGSYATIGKERAQVPLKELEGVYTGTWNDGRNSRPVSVNTRKMQAVIEDVY